MSAIENVGTYRGSIVDHGVSPSKNGAVDFSTALLAMEKYNFDTGEWEDYSKYDDNEITSHNYIYGAKGQIELTCKQVCKITSSPRRRSARSLFLPCADGLPTATKPISKATAVSDAPSITIVGISDMGKAR